ncbi:MAG: c-type cytochrome biogenesis protein CcmI [Betaproteobacteria bacterium]
MIAFVLIAALMVAAALAWVLVPLLGRHRSAGVGREASNVAILRDQRAELETDLANGTMPRDRYEQACRELEQRVLDESTASSPAAGDGIAPRAGAWTAAVLGGTIPIVAVVLYLLLGDHQAFAPGTPTAAVKAGEHDTSPQQVEQMVTNLAARLEKEPGNAEGWVILARTYYSMSKFPEAARAFERATALVPDNPDLLADYADALGAAQGGTLAGKPLELVNRALKIDPTHWKALALAGTAAFDRKDYKTAVELWERLKKTIPPTAPIAGSIDNSIAEARALGGMKPAAAAPAAAATAATAAAAKPTTATAPTPALPGNAVAGMVKLAPALAGKVAPTDVVYIFARAAEGPRMPLAILRKQVSELPVSFTLDDSMAMTPEMKLSNFPSIVVGARITKSGNPVPQSGDLEGLSAPVTAGARSVDIVIDRTLP